jgi:hypothetical protein
MEDGGRENSAASPDSLLELSRARDSFCPTRPTCGRRRTSLGHSFPVWFVHGRLLNIRVWGRPHVRGIRKGVFARVYCTADTNPHPGAFVP